MSLLRGAGYIQLGLGAYFVGRVAVFVCAGKWGYASAFAAMVLWCVAWWRALWWMDEHR